MVLIQHHSIRYCLLLIAVALAGCKLPSAHTYSRDYSNSPTRVVDKAKANGSFEDCVEGGQLYKMYCSQCHNTRPLGERNFRETEVSFSHMRTQAYLTGEEYRKLIHYLRRWHNLGPTIADTEPSPKRFFFDQPIAELNPSAKVAASSEDKEEQKR